MLVTSVMGIAAMRHRVCPRLCRQALAGFQWIVVGFKLILDRRALSSLAGKTRVKGWHKMLKYV
jgi:hypothetical protein